MTLQQTMQNYQAPADLLQDRLILVTGAGSGLGRAAAKAYAAHGATVVLLGKTQRKLEEVYDEIEAAGGPQAVIHPLNLEKAAPDDYAALAKAIKDHFGRLDGILHSAAFLGNLSPLEYFDAKLWYQVMQVNLHAPFHITQACLPLLRQAPDAAVIFTSARVGRKGYAYWGAYGVAKFGLEGMMQMLAEEVENSTAIRVNSLNPGAARTGLRIAAYPGVDPQTLPLPDELMNAYLYLMGPDSQGVRGQTLNAQANDS